MKAHTIVNLTAQQVLDATGQYVIRSRGLDPTVRYETTIEVHSTPLINGNVIAARVDMTEINSAQPQ